MGSRLGKGLFLSRALLELGVFSAVINMLLLVMPLYMLQVYDRIIPSSSLDTLFYISVIAFVAVVILGLLEAVRALYANRLAARLDVTCGAPLFKAAVTGQRAILGDVQPLRDLATIRSFIGSRAIFFLFDLPFGPFFIALLYFVHPILFAVTVAGGVVMVGLALANQHATRSGAKDAAEALSSAMISAQTFARNSETVRTLGMMEASSAYWGIRFARSLKASDRTIKINAAFGSWSRGIRLLLQIAMYGVGAYLTLKGQMTAGMIFAASMVSARALQPLDQIVGSWKQIAEASAAWKRVSAFLREQNRTAGDRTELPAPKGGVSAEDVIYYLPNARDGTPPLIKRISFSVRAGETLAIIGPSQAGKSTLARLLVGAIDPRSGAIRIDGADIRNWDREKLGPHIGYLSQEVELFPGTVAQNIARFDPAATSEQVIAAAERAQVHKMVLALQDGYDTLIGPMGVRLSGGEKQRIGLARALYGDPKLVVLDEPNANLDNEGEAALERAVQDAKARGATVVIITHRPAIAAKCDHVLVLRDGQIEQFGPAQEVFRRLSGAQAARQPKGEVVPMTARAASGGTAQMDGG
jgi:ATP-binding cassette subfamily C protein